MAALKFLQNKLVLTLIFVTSLGFSFWFGALRSNAGGNVSTATAECVGRGIASFAKPLLAAKNAGQLNNIELLSPTFNLTAPESLLQSIVLEMDASLAPYSLNDFYALSGNAYNTYNSGAELQGTITEYVGRLKSLVPNKRIIITEAGWYPPLRQVRDRPETIAELQQQLVQLQGDPIIEATILFNIFNTGNAASYPEGFFYHSLSTGSVGSNGGVTGEAVRSLCPGPDGNEDCSKVGAHSAAYTPAPSYFYDGVGSAGLGYTVEISTDADASSTIQAVNAAIAKGATPIIRIGDLTGSAFETPEEYLAFLELVNAGASGTVYAIAGPNEPESECWWDINGDCFPNGCMVKTDPFDVKVTIRGKVTNLNPVRDTLDGNRMKVDAPIRGVGLHCYQGTWDTESGNVSGFVDWDASTTTDGDGNYEIQCTRKADGGSFNNSVYLLLTCEEDDQVVDAWSVDLSNNVVEMNHKISCSDLNYDRPAVAPLTFSLQKLYNEKQPLACFGDENSTPAELNLSGSSEIALGYRREAYVGREGADGSYDNKDVGFVNGVPTRLPYSVQPSKEDLEGRDSTTGLGAKVTENPFGSYRGEEDRQVDPFVEGTEEERLAKLPLCENIEACNRLVIPETNEKPSQSMNTCYNYSVTMQLPNALESLHEVAKIANPAVCKDGTNYKYYNDFPNPFDDGVPSSSFSEYPVLAVLSAIDTTVYGQAFYENTKDSADCILTDGNPDIACSRKARLDDNEVEQDMKSYNMLPIIPSGVPETNLFASEMYASEKVAQDMGLKGPLGAVRLLPGLPFGLDENGVRIPQLMPGPDTGIIRSGKGHYQIGKPYLLCSCNFVDGACEEKLYEWDSKTKGDVKSPFTSGYRYLTKDPSLISWLQRFFFLITFHTLFADQEKIDFAGSVSGQGALGAYSTEYVDVVSKFGGPTMDNWDPSMIGSECLPFVDMAAGQSCDIREDWCEVSQCTSVPETACDTYGWDAVCTGISPATSYQCIFRKATVYNPDGLSQCRGDIVGPYTGIMYAPEDPTHPKEISAATELAALTFRLPSQEAYRTGSMTFHDIDPQNLLSDYDKERYAMNSGGSGVTTLQNVSSYVKVPNSTSYSGMEAPELVDKGDDGTGTTPPPPGFDGKCNGSVFASTFLKNAPNLSPTTSDVPNVSPQVEGVYAALEDVTGLACEIFAGLHYNETGGTNAPNRSIISGRVLGENEPDVGKTYPPCEEGDTTFESCLPGLYESGVDAARIFIAHSGTSASNLDYYSSVRAFSRYTSPFYKNCGHKLTQYNDPYVVYPGFAQYCSDPLPYEGYDNLPLNLIDSEHSNMGLMSCGFHPDFGNYVDICPIEPEINYNNDPPTGPDGEDLIGPFDQWFRMGSATAAYRWYQAVTSSRAER